MEIHLTFKMRKRQKRMIDAYLWRYYRVYAEPNPHHKLIDRLYHGTHLDCADAAKIEPFLRRCVHNDSICNKARDEMMKRTIIHFVPARE